MATVETPEVLGTFHGSEAVPDRVAGGRARALLDLRRPALPEPGVAAVLRHRRLVADVRPHVPALRHAVRVGLDRQADQRLRVHGRDPRRPVGARRGDRVPGALRAARPARRRVRGRDRRLPRARAARTTPRTSSTGGTTACAPRSSATSPTSTARTGTARRSPSSPCCSRTRSTSTTATGRSTGCSTSPSSRRPRPSTPPSRRSAARPTRRSSAACRARSTTATGTRSRTSGR